jgi:hypothetical protein
MWLLGMADTKREKRFISHLWAINVQRCHHLTHSGENFDYLIVGVDGFGVLSTAGSESGLPWQIGVPADSWVD